MPNSERTLGAWASTARPGVLGVADVGAAPTEVSGTASRAAHAAMVMSLAAVIPVIALIVKAPGAFAVGWGHKISWDCLCLNTIGCRGNPIASDHIDG